LERTVVASSTGHEQATRAQSAETPSDEKTRIVARTASAPQGPARDFLDDPVVGWLVILDGPGKGKSLELGYGQNSIGRAPDQRVRLDFGDDQISRQAHAFVTYDRKGRKYYVANGAGANLVYLGEMPVLAPTELPPNADLSLGGTTVRFVPLCGPDFDWSS
jgi:hypothetical protein